MVVCLLRIFPFPPLFLCFQRQETEREQPAAPPEPIPEPAVNEPTPEEISAAAEKTADDEFNALLQEIDAVSQKETQKQEALKNVENEQMTNGSEEELVDYNVLFHSFIIIVVVLFLIYIFFLLSFLFHFIYCLCIYFSGLFVSFANGSSTRSSSLPSMLIAHNCTRTTSRSAIRTRKRQDGASRHGSNDSINIKQSGTLRAKAMQLSRLLKRRRSFSVTQRAAGWGFATQPLLSSSSKAKTSKNKSSSRASSNTSTAPTHRKSSGTLPGTIGTRGSIKRFPFSSH